MERGEVQIMGNVEVPGIDGEIDEYPLSLLIQFKDKESFKRAVDERRCEFDIFGEEVSE